MKVNELVKAMNSSAFGSGSLAASVDIIEAMVKDKNCKVFLGIAGALVPAGMKQIIIDMLKNNWIDVFVTTGANLTHDLVEALGYSHQLNTENLSDAELYDLGYDRIFNSLMPNKAYEDIELFFEKNIDKIKEAKNIKEFLWILGSLVKNDSILKTCYDKKIPIFCPAIADSGIGMMIWGRLMQGHKIKIDAFDDLKEIVDIAWTAKKKGVIYLGGGTSKNYIQQAMQFSNKDSGANYGVQITMDRPEPGGSSGAPLKEGISWGKLNKDARYVDVIADVTIALPIIYAGLIDRL